MSRPVLGLIITNATDTAHVIIIIITVMSRLNSRRVLVLSNTSPNPRLIVYSLYAHNDPYVCRSLVWVVFVLGLVCFKRYRTIEVHHSLAFARKI